MSRDDSDGPLSDDERIWVLLDRYLAGDAQSSDVAFVREWVSADPARAEVLEDLRRIRQVAIASHRHRSAGDAWQRLLPHLDAGADAPSAGGAAGAHRAGAARHERRVPDTAHVTWPRARRWVAAAALLLVAGVPLAVLSRIAQRSAALAAQASRAAGRSFATARGRRAEVRLPDGTLVSLAPESRVTWMTLGDTLARDVLLEGEAYFDVVHDAARPFRVRARNVVIRDVGTRFAVRAYATDSVVEVAVTHGRVRLRTAKAAPASGTMLEPGMVGTVDAAGVTALRSDSDTARYNAFARGQMLFVRTPLHAVITELDRWYDVDIQVSDSALAGRRITATLDDQTLPDLLAQLSVTLNVRVSREGRVIVLHAN
jgi:transmembrane sensor